MTEKDLHEKKISELSYDIVDGMEMTSIHYLKQWAIAMVKEIDKRVGKGPWKNGKLIRIEMGDGFMDAIPEYWIFLKDFLIARVPLTKEDLK